MDRSCSASQFMGGSQDFKCGEKAIGESAQGSNLI